MSETQTRHKCCGGEPGHLHSGDGSARRVTVPDDGRSKPAHRPSKVVLPLPDGPTTAQVVPAARERDILEDSEWPSFGMIGFADMLHVQKRSCLHMPCIACLMLFSCLVNLGGIPALNLPTVSIRIQPVTKL